MTQTPAPRPFKAVHPGEILRDEIEYRGISLEALAEMSGLGQKELSGLLSARAPLTAEMALLLEKTLDIPTRPLLKMQTDYDLQRAIESPSFLQRMANARKYVATL